MKRTTAFIAAACALLMLAIVPTRANHFAGATLSWAPDGPPTGKVKFALVVYFDRTEMSNSYNNPGGGAHGYVAQVGDILYEYEGDEGTHLNFGDGNQTPSLRFVVDVVDVANDIVRTVALEPSTDNPGIPHTYSNTASPITAYVEGCCRMTTEHLNNRVLDPFKLETRITFDGNNSPIATMPLPIIKLCEGTTSTFIVSAVDPDGNPIRYRLSTDAEATACVSCDADNASPSGLTSASINPVTGVVTWNTVGLASSKFYTVQLMAEDFDGSGNVRSRTPIDFLLKIDQCGGPFETPTLSLNETGCWPPNHKLRNIHATISLGDYTSFQLLSITNSELDNGLGDGNTINDIQGAVYGTNDVDFKLRCERSGKGSGRVYTIAYRFFGPSLPDMDMTATYTVPHDQSKKKIAVGTGEWSAKGVVLNQNHPNPFGKTTNISYSLKETDDVTLMIYNTNGEEVRTLYSGAQSAGSYSTTWDGLDNSGKRVPSGIYFYQLQTGSCGCGPVMEMHLEK
jgi:hypothetical protein